MFQFSHRQSTAKWQQGPTIPKLFFGQNSFQPAAQLEVRDGAQQSVEDIRSLFLLDVRQRLRRKLAHCVHKTVGNQSLNQPSFTMSAYSSRHSASHAFSVHVPFPLEVVERPHVLHVICQDLHKLLTAAAHRHFQGQKKVRILRCCCVTPSHKNLERFWHN